MIKDKFIKLFEKKTIILFLILLTTIFLFAQHTENFQFGKRMYEDGHLQEARIVFERIISTNPTSSEAEESYLLLIEIHINNNEYEESESYSRRLYENFPSGRYREQALMNMAISQYRQHKYSQSLETLNRFINNYPASLKLDEAYYKLINCHYQLTNYSRVLSISRDYIGEKPNSERVPDLMLLKAKSYLKLLNYSDAENTLDLIMQRYTDSQARWESVLIKVDLLKKYSGIQQAIEEIEKHLTVRNILREYEEKLVSQLAYLYQKNEQHGPALNQFQKLINKFDRSPQIGKYLYWFAELNTKKGNYQTIINHFEQFSDQFTDTSYYFDFLIVVVEAHFAMNNVQQAEILIDQLNDYYLLDIEPNLKDNLYAFYYWQAQLKEYKEMFIDAVSDYQKLISKVPVHDKWHIRSLMRIGDIYLHQLRAYSTSINIYNQVVSQANIPPKILARALYHLAISYDLIGDHDRSLIVLKKINIDDLDDQEDKDDVMNKIELIRNFRTMDYKKSTSRLLVSLINYLQDDNKDNLKDELIYITLFDLKDAKSVIDILKEDDSYKANYIIGKAYLQKIHQIKLENQTTKSDRKLSSLFELMDGITSKLQEIAKDEKSVKPWALELQIELSLVKNDFQITPDMVTNIEMYLQNYPDSNPVNRFKFFVGSFYLKDNIYIKANEYFKDVSLSSDIPLTSFHNEFTKLASYFFQNDQYEKALFYYQQLDELIERSSDTMYQYAVSLIKSGQAHNGVQLLNRLIKKTVNFDGINSAINVLADYYSEREDYQKLVNTMKLLPHNQRDSSFYRRFSQGYIEIGNKEKAKESLMYIVEKDIVDIRNLALLHYKTGDLIMAKISYNQLVDSADEIESLADSHAMLGHIYFIDEDWQNALKHYEKVLDSINNNQDKLFLSPGQIIEETVISLYRINNRPRAERISKRFSTFVDEHPDRKARLSLNEGIYQMNVNRNRADRLFRDIVREDTYSENIKYEAYFWRGVNRLEQKQTDDSWNDFKEAAKTEDPHLRNQALLKLGTISFSRENFHEALDYYYTVIRDDTTSELAVDAARNFAIVCKTIQEWQKAIEAYQIILDRGAGGKLQGETIFDIAFCQFRDRNYHEAIQMFERAITLLDDREIKAEAQYWIGESYASLDLYDQAATEYLKVNYYYPDLVEWSAIAEIKLSQAYVKQGRVSAAKGILERVISRYGRDSDWGRQAAVILEEL